MRSKQFHFLSRVHGLICRANLPQPSKQAIQRLQNPRHFHVSQLVRKELRDLNDMLEEKT